MKQKLFRSLLALVFSCTAFLPTALAAFEPGDRYAHITTNDKFSLYYDTEKMDYGTTDPNSDKAVLTTWIYWVFPNEKCHTAVKTTFSAEKKTMTEYFEINYDSETNEMISQNYTRPFRTEQIKPGSIGETIYNALFKK